MTITTPQLARYPDSWPIPQISPHAGLVDAGLVRSPQKGFPQQYRFMSTGATRMTMTFRIALADWTDWVTWINTYGITRWCVIPCVDQHEVIDPTPTYDYSVARFTGRIRRVPLGELYVDAQCEVDLWPINIGVAKPGRQYFDGLSGIGAPGRVCEEIEYLFYQVAGSRWYSGVTGEQVWPFPFPAGGFDALQDSTISGLADWGPNSFVQKTYDGTIQSQPHFPVNTCEPNKEQLYIEMTDGNGVGGVTAPYFVPSSRKSYDGQDGFATVIGRPDLHLPSSVSNFIQSRLWRGSFVFLKTDLSTETDIGTLELTHNTGTDTLTFTYTHFGRSYTEGPLTPGSVPQFSFDWTWDPGLSVVGDFWVPITVKVSTWVQSAVLEGNIRWLIGRSSITIGVADQIYIDAQDVVFGLGANTQLADYEIYEQIVPEAYGLSRTPPSIMFDSKLALGGIGLWKGDHNLFWDSFRNNAIA